MSESMDHITDEMADNALKLDNQLCFPLYAAARQITGAYTPYLKPLGLTYTQYIVFLVLWEQDDITVSDIGKRLHLDTGTLTPLLKKMEGLGYISRRRSQHDERAVLISLTDKGKQLKTRVKEIPFKVGSCVHLSASDAKALHTLLYKLLSC